MAKIHLPHTRVLDLPSGPRKHPRPFMALKNYFGSLLYPASCLGRILGVELDDLSNGYRLTLVTLRHN